MRSETNHPGHRAEGLECDRGRDASQRHPCGATFDENSVPPWTRGTSGGFAKRKPTHPGAARHPSAGGDLQESRATFASFPRKNVTPASCKQGRESQRMVCGNQNTLEGWRTEDWIPAFAGMTLM